ncbi:restriction endonuclease subunit S [Rugamonas sp. CCM 8940]|uniref:restriction endonuclease subunit S n=1 Tax=Rugamonas sp. CCM 8940 TaxID=2765359 RepID=UPI0018F78510|nr:restriction endonuclease subunit S [Rugamonas sp. CCM 8940]MBJ7309420.1 restriction endonuclease subunit S [Rugamonas sp. CCM 8940]
MMIDANILHIAEVADVRGGYPFRGSIEEWMDGSALAVQMKDVDPEHGVSWPGVIRTELAGRKQPDWLKEGDILVVSKGARFYAVCLDHPPRPAVCSPHFFHLQVKSSVAVLPAFVAWQINQPPFQRQLLQAAEGSSQLSIRRPVLEALTLSIPSLGDQRRIVALVELARQERQTLKQLIRNRELQINALADALFQAAT